MSTQLVRVAQTAAAVSNVIWWCYIFYDYVLHVLYVFVLLVLVGGEHVLGAASCACLLYCVSHVLGGGNDLVAYQASILIYHNPDHNSNPGPETSSAGVPWDRCAWKGSSCCAGKCKELRPRGQTHVKPILPHPRDIFVPLFGLTLIFVLFSGHLFPLHLLTFFFPFSFPLYSLSFVSFFPMYVGC